MNHDNSLTTFYDSENNMTPISLNTFFSKRNTYKYTQTKFAVVNYYGEDHFNFGALNTNPIDKYYFSFEISANIDDNTTFLIKNLDIFPKNQRFFNYDYKLINETIHITPKFELNKQNKIFNEISRIFSDLLFNLFEFNNKNNNIVVLDSNCVTAIFFAFYTGPFLSKYQTLNSQRLMSENNVIPYVMSEQYYNLKYYLQIEKNLGFTAFFKSLNWTRLESLVANPTFYINKLLDQENIKKSELFHFLEKRDKKNEFSTLPKIEATDIIKFAELLLPNYYYDIDWTNAKLSTEHFYLPLIYINPSNFIVIAKTTKYISVKIKANGKPIPRNGILIQYFEVSKLKNYVKGAGEKFLVLWNQQNQFKLWVDTIVSSSEAMGFWEKMERLGLILLTDSAKKSILEWKKNLLLKYLKDEIIGNLKLEKTVFEYEQFSIDMIKELINQFPTNQKNNKIKEDDIMMESKIYVDKNYQKE